MHRAVDDVYLDRNYGGTAAFVAAIGATCLVLWNAHRMASLQLAGSSAFVLVLLWLVGWISERGEHAPEVVRAA